ncbi:putative aldouronate transport system substrate-binding protein [Cohnella lupini]|uniref:Putative aldouronate transport system substrate-binding protein n=2 Tax=Cohnella lupini TaxID=1294267 RepID=A0A3D9HSW9_9BACL|nr:putative aldouronate transport system substrate-binding protein [Cohnella lupini]
MAVLMLVAVACSNNNAGNSASSDSPSSSAPASASAAPSESAPAVAEGPLAKYDPPIELTTVRHQNSGVKFMAGEDWDNNIYTRELAVQLGIKLKNNWVVDDLQFPKKLSVSMVAGDLPDFFEVNLQQLQLLVDAGQIADLTEVYDKYASDLTKRSIEESGGVKKDVSSFGGKLMAIPLDGGGRTDAQFLYIRNDWLKKVGLEPPKNMDDVIAIAKAFANDDPDGNGKKDTFGLSLDFNLFNGWSGVDGFFNGYHAYPFNPGGPNSTGLKLVFMKGADGQLAYADIQPEVKTALGKLQELYKAGAINPEFGVINGEKSAEIATSGKVGMTFGATFVPSWPLNDMVANDPNVDWGVYPLVSADDQPVKALSNGIVPTRYMVVNKKSEHPEALIKMLNFYLEVNYGESRDEEYHTHTEGDTVFNTFSYAPVQGGFASTNIDDGQAVIKALDSGDPSALTPTAKVYYDNILKYRGGDRGQWWYEKTFAKGSAYDLLFQYQEGDKFATNEFTGSPTDTMVSKASALRDLQVQTFTRIITGESLDSFDKFVENWKAQGGDAITKEVNDWYAQKHAQ